MNKNNSLTNLLKDIKSFKDACLAINLDYDKMFHTAYEIALISLSSAAMFELNIIKTALNLEYDLHLTKNPENSLIYIPSNPLAAKKESYSDTLELIGEIKYKNKNYFIFGGYTNFGIYKGLSGFECSYEIGITKFDGAFLGCATKEIAKHFGKYFGMLITEAKYGDLPGFKIVSSKYKI